jgi:dTDP-4-amino-4,6-dideoxygalactose transaminase
VGVARGDVVVTVANAGIPPLAAIAALGARPLFVDVEPDSACLDPAQLEAVTDPGVRAVLVVHMYGHPANLPALLGVARARGWKLVEDCSHAHGSRCHGQAVGTFGDAAAFSFYPTKNLGAFGDGGMVVTGDDAVRERALLLRNYGWDEERISLVPSGHSRLDELQAAILSAKLPRLEAWNERRRQLAQRYCALLAAGVATPIEHPWARHVYHLFAIRSGRRERLRQHLEAAGIGTRIHYSPPAYAHPAYREHAPASPLPVTERLAREVLSLPLYPELEMAQVELVAETVNRFAAAE